MVKLNRKMEGLTMCKAYEETSKTFDNILINDIVNNGKHLSYLEILDQIKQETNSDFSYRYSTGLTILGRLNFLESVGYLRRDNEGRFYKNNRGRRSSSSQKRRLARRVLPTTSKLMRA